MGASLPSGASVAIASPPSPGRRRRSRFEVAAYSTDDSDDLSASKELPSVRRGTVAEPPEQWKNPAREGAKPTPGLEPRTPSLRVKRVYSAESAISLQIARSVRGVESAEVRGIPQRSSDVFQRCSNRGRRRVLPTHKRSISRPGHGCPSGLADCRPSLTWSGRTVQPSQSDRDEPADRRLGR